MGHLMRNQGVRLDPGARPELQTLVEQMQADQRQFAQANPWVEQLPPPQQQMARAARVMQYLSDILLRNEGNGRVARYLGNGTAALIRAGLPTIAGTFVRNFVGFLLQQKLNSNLAAALAANPHDVGTSLAANLIGGLSTAVPLMLHAIQFVEDKRPDGQANWMSNTARGALIAYHVGGVAAAAATGNWRNLAARVTEVMVYSAFRGVGGAWFRTESNVNGVGAAAILSAAGAYTVAQAAETTLQEYMDWNSGASAASLRVQDSTGANRSSSEIQAATHDRVGNLGHSVLNGTVEIFDELQLSAIARAVEVGKDRPRYRTLNADRRAELRAAALMEMMRQAQLNPRATDEQLMQAGALGVSNFLSKRFEGLRMSLKRVEPDARALANQGARARAFLANIGYPRDPLPGSDDERLRTAFVAQWLAEFRHRQPLETPGGGGWSETWDLLRSRFVHVEPLRMNAFAGLHGYMQPAGSALGKRLHDTHATPGASSVAVGGTVGAFILPAYLALVPSITTRHPRAPVNQPAAGVAIAAGDADPDIDHANQPELDEARMTHGMPYDAADESPV